MPHVPSSSTPNRPSFGELPKLRQTPTTPPSTHKFIKHSRIFTHWEFRGAKRWLNHMLPKANENPRPSPHRQNAVCGLFLPLTNLRDSRPPNEPSLPRAPNKHGAPSLAYAHTQSCPNFIAANTCTKPLSTPPSRTSPARSRQSTSSYWFFLEPSTNSAPNAPSSGHCPSSNVSSFHFPRTIRPNIAKAQSFHCARDDVDLILLLYNGYERTISAGGFPVPTTTSAFPSKSLISTVHDDFIGNPFVMSFRVSSSAVNPSIPIRSRV